MAKEIQPRENVLYDKAYSFSIKIVDLFGRLQGENKEFILSRQVLQCGTSIGANIAEANGGISKAKFLAKISIAYKECLETRYWLCLLKDTGFLEKKVYDILYDDIEELIKILFTIVRTNRVPKDYVAVRFYR